MREIKELIDGFARFKAKADMDLYASLKRGQTPHTLVISCCDSRIIPEHIFDAGPGELFVLRNIGNRADTANPSVQAAIDYAIKHLGVRRIAVLGHAQCGAVKATEKAEYLDTDGLSKWLCEEKFDMGTCLCAEKTQILRQLDKLLEYPLINESALSGKLEVCALYFNLDPLSVEAYSNGEWQAI